MRWKTPTQEQFNRLFQKARFAGKAALRAGSYATKLTRKKLKTHKSARKLTRRRVK